MEKRGLEETRYPRQPPRRDIAEDELWAYDEEIARFRSKEATPEDPLGNDPAEPLEGGDGEPDLGPYYGVLMNGPTLGRAWSNLGNLVRVSADRPGSYSHADRELCNLTVGHFVGRNFGEMHIDHSLLTGVRLEAIEALRGERGTGERPQEQDPRLNDDERLIVTFIRQVITGKLTDEIYERMYERMGRRGVFDYTIFCVVMLATDLLHLAFDDMVPKTTNEEVDEIIRGYRDGTREVPSQAEYDKLNR